jgi:hypothetical protein
VKGLNGNAVSDDAGHPGFPGARPTATQSLGYAATLLEAGVQVLYVAIGDARRSSGHARASGPGEPDHLARLAEYDAAFESFVDRLAARGITKHNTLFVVVSTGNDRFAGGPPLTPGCDGFRVPCRYGPVGAIDAAVDRLLATERRNVSIFEIQRDSTPAFYVRGDPRPTDPLTRALAQDVSKLFVLNPITGKSDRLAAMIADRAELQLMHMVTASPARTPTFLMFGDSNYLYRAAQSSADCAAPPACIAVDPDITWVRGDVQQIRGGGWFGMAGPGVARLGQSEIVFHHADLRPTMLALLGLSDSYVHDGVVLAEAFESQALPPEISESHDAYVALALAYWNLNAPFGPLARASLALATHAIKGGDIVYQRYLDTIDVIRTQRDALAQHMKTLVDGAAFAHRQIDVGHAGALIARAGALIEDVEGLAARSLGPADRPWKAASDAH